MLGNGHYWLHLLWAALVNFIVSTVTFSVMVSWVATALGGTSYWFWSIFLPQRGQDVYPAHWLLTHIGLLPAGVDPEATDKVAYLVVGLLFLVTAPFVIRGLVWAHWGWLGGCSGPSAATVCVSRSPTSRRRAARPSPRRAPLSGGSSATSTTARSSGWSACRWTSPPPTDSSTRTRSMRAG
ncbi:hypothetical protein GCM10025881_32720 [Pseudolysinimonas kribbensis]|uniref:Putative sensor domain-containing protein n=1 Tax=Pseudolysinimonas kribbensis TaxID=433641 RepID=A0ABQ6K718_9MICO|nr:hypothetical protein GCM10025881_32720 [Pseudolysinimonas kribbensis]